MKVKGKSFIAGLLIGIMCTATISVYGYVVNAWVEEGVSIVVDGKSYQMPEDHYIINYDGRYYAPVRMMADALGAEKVTWYDERKAFHISMPELSSEVVVVEKIVEVKPEETYLEAPVRKVIDNVTINIIGIDKNDEHGAYLYLDVKNEYGMPIFIDYKNAYILINDVQYPAKTNTNKQYGWGNTIDPSSETKDAMLEFEGIPSDVDQMKIVIPVGYWLNRSSQTETIKNFEFNVDFTHWRANQDNNK